MIARIDSFVLQGIEAVRCEIEVEISTAQLPSTRIVGLPDAAVRESNVRVRSALRSGMFRYPLGRVTINLAPADIRKEGPVYDLPIALAVLHADGTIESGTDSAHDPAHDHAHDRAGDSALGPSLDEPVDVREPERPAARPRVLCDVASVRPCIRDFLVAGELALDGRLRPVRGVMSLALLARRLGRRGAIVPAANAAEAAAVDGVEILGASSVDDVVAFLNGQGGLAPHVALDTDSRIAAARPKVDFADVRGQEAAKRALTVAAAGGHNVLMIGPAGTGKTMMAKALPGVLPPLTREEAIEVTRIYSCAGKLPADGALVVHRPVRTPHHTASAAAIIGGGSVPRPGDVSLAHRGVLFLDEMPEFSRNVLETLCQPLEDGCVTIARVRGSVRFPARFMLVAALNPAGDGDGRRRAPPRGEPGATDRYLPRLSRPLVDRVDIHVEVPAVSYRELTGVRPGTDTATIRTRVSEARARQGARQGPSTNAELSGRDLNRYAAMDDAGRLLLAQAMSELGLSARAYDKVRRVARTIADLDASDAIQAHHVAEAVQYRLLDRSPGGRC